MKVMQLIGISAAAVLSFSLVLLAPGTSAADREVNSGEILLLSDEILGNSVEIERAGGGVPPTNGVPGGLPDGPAPVPTLADGGGGDGGGSDGGFGDSDSDSGDSDSGDSDGDSDSDSDGSSYGNDHNRSGHADSTNPGLGGSTSNSLNQGTNNPNNAHR